MTKMTKQQLLAVSDMSEDEQRVWCWFNIKSVHDSYYRKEDVELADLAFRLSGGKIAGKKPIEHIIDALIKDLDR